MSPIPRRKGAPQCGVGCRGWLERTAERRIARHSRTAPLLSRVSHRSAALFRRRDQSALPRPAAPAPPPASNPPSHTTACTPAPGRCGNPRSVRRAAPQRFCLRLAFAKPALHCRGRPRKRCTYFSSQEWPPFLISAASLPPRKGVPIPCPAHIRQRHSRCPSVPCPGSSPPDTVPLAAGHRRSSLSGDACGSFRCGW